MTTILSLNDAIKFLGVHSGRVGNMDDDDIEFHVSEIGDPAATIPLTQTNETIEDFKASGWESFRNGDLDKDGIVWLNKKNITATIADIGDYRLVYIDR